MFSTLATMHWRAMVKYVAIRMSVMVCCCYVFTSAANAQTPPVDSTARKSAADTTISTSKNAADTSSAGKAAVDTSAVATAAASSAKDSSEISKIEDLKIPFEMAYRVKHMTPGELDSMRIVFQKVVNEENEEGDKEEKIITIKMRFTDDHLMGYMTKAPIHHSNKYVVENMPINIKIEWCCTADSTHPQHCAATLAEVKHLDSTEHCTRWHQMDDGTDMMKQVAEKKTKYKNLKHPKTLFGRVVEFVTFRRKKYILIPIDRTFEELLKPPVKGEQPTPSPYQGPQNF